jgi:hypothetical protein
MTKKKKQQAAPKKRNAPDLTRRNQQHTTKVDEGQGDKLHEHGTRLKAVEHQLTGTIEMVSRFESRYGELEQRLRALEERLAGPTAAPPAPARMTGSR